MPTVFEDKQRSPQKNQIVLLHKKVIEVSIADPTTLVKHFLDSAFGQAQSRRISEPKSWIFRD